MCLFRHERVWEGGGGSFDGEKALLIRTAVLPFVATSMNFLFLFSVLHSLAFSYCGCKYFSYISHILIALSHRRLLPCGRLGCKLSSPSSDFLWFLNANTKGEEFVLESVWVVKPQCINSPMLCALKYLVTKPGISGQSTGIW